LLHKQGKLKDDPDYSESGDYYWAFTHFPKEVEEGDRVYFATKGFIRGYFIIKEIDYEEQEDSEAIIFNSFSWMNIKLIPCTHFQGFKYANKVKELNNFNL